MPGLNKKLVGSDARGTKSNPMMMIGTPGDEGSHGHETIETEGNRIMDP